MTPQLVAWAYRHGYFPMALTRHGPVDWYSPDPRAVLPLDGLKVSRSLRKRLQRQTYEVTFDRSFPEVVQTCADIQRDSFDSGGGTWINDEIIRTYRVLHELGVAHSVEAYADGELVGGLYGLAIGAAFFGESMFHRATDASKVCLVHLVEHLIVRHFELLDTQIINDHMASLGAIEISRDEYLRRLSDAVAVPDRWAPPSGTGDAIDT